MAKLTAIVEKFQMASELLFFLIFPFGAFTALPVGLFLSARISADSARLYLEPEVANNTALLCLTVMQPF